MDKVKKTILQIAHASIATVPDSFEISPLLCHYYYHHHHQQHHHCRRRQP
jgi:hypothetical protein